MKSDYIIYVDELGDHGLNSIDPDYPIFVLSFCCFQIGSYINNVVPLLQKFKFEYFGHDQIILHEHHVRKQKGDFSFLRTDKEKRTHFFENINQIMEKIELHIFTVIIDKTKLTKKYKLPENPYNLSLLFGLESA